MSVSTEHFTDALAAAHNYTDSSDEAKNMRVAAEEYLMNLQSSADGLNLAFHILSNEDFQELRCFWAFQTILFHFPNISHMSNDQANEVYATLFAWIHRYCCTPGIPALPNLIINKHAQMMVAGMQAFFPSRWGEFFNDLFSFLEMQEHAEDQAHADQIVNYFLRIFEYIDERVVNKNAEKSIDQRKLNMDIKDEMRESVINRVVPAWFQILCEYREKNLDIARLCLNVVQVYIDWIEIALFMDDDWINIFYFFTTIPCLRQGGCECLLGIVNKKQLPPMKFQTIQGMRLVEALPDIVNVVVAGEPTNEEEETFLLDVVLLGKCTLQQLMKSAEEGNIQEAAEAIHALFPDLSPLFRIKHFQVREIILEILPLYVKSNVIVEEEAREVLDILYQQTILSEEELYQPSDETVEQRKNLHNVLRIIYQRQSDMVLDHCGVVLTQVTHNPEGKDARNLPGEMVEAATRYMYELGEAIKSEWLRDPNYPFSQMVNTLLHSTVSTHESPVVHLAYFELFERVHQYFIYFKDEIELLLQQLIFEPCGINNAQPKVRGRICYHFSRLTTCLKNEFAAHGATLVNGVMGILNDGNSNLNPQDKQDVYEALGKILSVSDLDTLAQVAEDSVSILQTLCQNPSEQGAFEAADSISFLSSLAKGIRGDTKYSNTGDSPSMSGAGGQQFPPNSMLPSSAANGLQDRPPSVQVFFQVTQCVFATLEVYSTSWVVREKALLFMGQMINNLQNDCSSFIEDLIPKMLQTTNITELPRILRLLGQFINMTKSNFAELLGENLIPMIIENVKSVCNFDEIEMVMGVFSDAVKEQIEAAKAYFYLVHTIVHTTAIVCLECPNAQNALPTLMNQHLIWALQADVETELPKWALQIFSRLASAWCTPDQQTPSQLETFLFEEALPVALEVFTSPHHSPEFLKDAKVFAMVSEYCQLLKILVKNLGDRGLYAIYGILTANHPMCMPSNDAYAFCGRLRDEQRATGQLKNGFRAALEEAQQANIAKFGGGGGQNMVMQQ